WCSASSAEPAVLSRGATASADGAVLAAVAVSVEVVSAAVADFPVAVAAPAVAVLQGVGDGCDAMVAALVSRAGEPGVSACRDAGNPGGDRGGRGETRRRNLLRGRGASTCALPARRAPHSRARRKRVR